MAEYEAKLNELKDRLELAKKKKIRAEARLEELNNQKNEIINQLKEMGVSPEELDSQINILKQQIESQIENIEAMLPVQL